MGKYRKYKNSLEKFLSSEKGKRFFNFAYSWGAAVVICGAMFKLLHFSGANLMLGIGMTVESIVFFISAFDRSYAEKEYNWEEVFPVLKSKDPEDRPEFGATGIQGGNGIAGGTVIVGGANLSGNPVEGGEENIISGGVAGGGIVGQSFGIPSQIEVSAEDTKNLSDSIKKLTDAAEQLSKMAELTDTTQEYLERVGEMVINMGKFSEATSSLTNVSNTLVDSYKHITDNSEGIGDSSRGYVEQMSALNRNLMGLNAMYEIQLKGVSSQIAMVENVNNSLQRIRNMYEHSMEGSDRFKEETEKMSRNLASLNNVYERMLHAMQGNMFNRPPM
ncbi:MAG: gliding motility protein GldL [Candidatus Azobacteroides sp.]|nr:gliding motility protein GldL [Candidatus Azobacteroides sp.]